MSRNPPRSIDLSEPLAAPVPKTSGARAIAPIRDDVRIRRGTITAIFGCMFSGKTTELLRRLSEYPRGKALPFKHAIDTRYSASRIVSHGGKASPAIVVADAAAIARHVTDEIDFIALDEAHFFDQGLTGVVKQMAQRGVDVVLTLLQPDSWGRPFPVGERLFAIADEAVVMTATCARCAAPADRTQRLTPILDGRMVVEPDNYEPRCLKCWRPPPEAPPCVSLKPAFPRG